MVADDKQPTDGDLDFFVKELLDDLRREPAEKAIAEFDDRDTLASIEKFWSGGTRLEESSDVSVPDPAFPIGAWDTADKPSSVVSSMSPIAVRHLFRATKRKAGKARPNCFGSKYLHEPDSTDCRPCKYAEGCKKAIVDEQPVLEAMGKAHIAGLSPAVDFTRLNSMRAFIRERHLREFRKSRKRRRQKDTDYQRHRRANPSTEILIKTEAQKRLVALRSATANPGRNKRVEQLLGREEMIIAVWIARQHAIQIHGIGATDTETANCFVERGGGPFSRHQARSYRLLFNKLGNPLKKTSPKLPA